MNNMSDTDRVLYDVQREITELRCLILALINTQPLAERRKIREIHDKLAIKWGLSPITDNEIDAPVTFRL